MILLKSQERKNMKRSRSVRVSKSSQAYIRKLGKQLGLAYTSTTADLILKYVKAHEKEFLQWKDDPHKFQPFAVKRKEVVS